jgi:hypothetical protein
VDYNIKCFSKSMKIKGGLAALAIILLSMAAGCNKTDEDMQPITKDADVRQAVLGKWRIERVNNKLCKSGNCTSVVYNGSANDFFEFKADSAFLQRVSSQSSSSVYRDSFKADYRQADTFVLSNFGWSARFRIMHRDQRSLVLESTYAGNDPNAIFTDTYFLYK